MNTRNHLRIGLAFPELDKHGLDHFLPIIAAHKGEVDLVVFPEGFELVPACASCRPGKIPENAKFAAIRATYIRAARACAAGIVVGVAVDYGNTSMNGDGNDQYCMFVSPDGETNLYHKHSTSRFNAFFDDDWSIEDNFPVVDVKGVKVGFSVCHDAFISLIPKVLKAKGAEVWVNISYQNVKPHIWQPVLHARAAENEVLAVYTLHRNSRKSHPQKEPYAFSEGGKIRLRDLRDGMYLSEISDTRRAGRVFWFDTARHEVDPPEEVEPAEQTSVADPLVVESGPAGDLKIGRGEADHSISDISIETFVRFPERMWKVCLQGRKKSPNWLPVFVMWAKDAADWMKSKSAVMSVVRGRVIEFSTLFLVMSKDSGGPLLAAYRSSNYKDTKVLAPSQLPIKIDKRYLKGLDSTYWISLDDGRQQDDAVYFQRVQRMVDYLTKK
jgi:predicted amidohydrolase